MGNFVSSGPNEALLISGLRGTRISAGTTVWRTWVVEKVSRLSLEMITLELHSVDCETLMGVRVSVTGVAQVKIHARLENEFVNSGPEKGVAKLDKRLLIMAAQHYLGDTEDRLNKSLRQTLEGHQRSIVSTLTVEQLYKDRAAVSRNVRDHMDEDLAKMGFEVVSYSIMQISDNGGYMESLGASQTAAVQREAAEGTARHQAEAKIKVAQAEAQANIEAAKAERQSHVVRNEQKLAEAESDQLLELKRAEIASRVGQAKEVSDAAARIEKARQEQEVVRQKTVQQLIEKEVHTRIAEQEAERIRLEMQGAAQARLAAQEADAKALMVRAEAEAARVRLLAEAEAAAIRLKGEAEAANLKLQAEAYAQFGDAALTVMALQKFPEIAAAICAPLAKTEKMVFVSGGGAGEAGAGGAGGPSLFTRDVTNILTQLPHAVEALTGFDLQKAIANTKERGAAGGGAPGTRAIQAAVPHEDVAL